MKYTMRFTLIACIFMNSEVLAQSSANNALGSGAGGGAPGSGFVAPNSNSSSSQSGGFGGGTFGSGGFPSTRPFTGYPGLLTYNMGGFYRGQSLSDAPVTNFSSSTINSTMGTNTAAAAMSNTSTSNNSRSTGGGGSSGGGGGGGGSGGGSGSSNSRNVIGDDWIY